MRPPVPRGSRELPKPRPRPPGGHLAQPRGPQIFQSLLNFSRFLFRFFQRSSTLFHIFSIFLNWFHSVQPFFRFFRFFQIFSAFFPSSAWRGRISRVLACFLGVSGGSYGARPRRCRFFPIFQLFSNFCRFSRFFFQMFFRVPLGRAGFPGFLRVSWGSLGGATAHTRGDAVFFSAFFQFFSRSSFFLVAHTPLRIGVNSDGANPPAHMYLMSLGR